MARFARANRFADSAESPGSHEPFQGSGTANRAFGGLKLANRRFEAIRANRSHVMKIGFLFFSARPSKLGLSLGRPESYHVFLLPSLHIFLVRFGARFLPSFLGMMARNPPGKSPSNPPKPMQQKS